jgi:hypothetical protein
VFVSSVALSHQKYFIHSAFLLSFGLVLVGCRERERLVGGARENDRVRVLVAWLGGGDFIRGSLGEVLEKSWRSLGEVLPRLGSHRMDKCNVGAVMYKAD